MKILKYLYFLLMVGCASSPISDIKEEPSVKVKWVVDSNVDEFSDQKICTVTVGSLYTAEHVYTYSKHYYPYVKFVDGEVRVGIKSGGNIKSPVGDVQVRIDDNSTWIIGKAETTMDEAPEPTAPMMKINVDTKESDVDQKKYAETYNDSYRNIMKSIAVNTLPYTTASGEKAKKILDEMLRGTILKYRVFELYQAGSTTGKFFLNESFINAIAECRKLQYEI